MTTGPLLTYIRVRRFLSGLAPEASDCTAIDGGRDSRGALVLTAGSPDAALLVTPPRGSDIAIVSGAVNSAGIAEIYEVPEGRPC